MGHSDPLISVRGDHWHAPLPLRIAWRYFVSGTALHGPGDNATFLHHATVDYRARPYERLTRRRWERLARRHAALTVPMLLAACGIVAGRWPLVAYLCALASAALSWATWRAVHAVQARPFNKAADPAARTLCASVGVPYRKKSARKLVQLPRTWGRELEGQDMAPVRIVVPTDKPLTVPQRRNLVNAVGGRLGITNPSGSWLETGLMMTVDILGVPLPPKVVTFDELRVAILTADPHRPIVGKAAGRDPLVTIDYQEDSPHVAVSGPSGTGKSTLAMLLLAQRMHWGNGVIFIDPKRWSHKWAHRLPADRAQYWFRPADMHNALVALGEELERRRDADESELGNFRTVDVVVEEINSAIRILTSYWRGERRRIMNAAKRAMAEDMDYDEADLDPPATSPAVLALQYAVNMGREVQIHIHVMAQRLSAAVFGGNGGDIRESFQTRLMAKWDKKLWDMLASGVPFVPWPAGKRGQWGLVSGDTVRIFRVPRLSVDEAIWLATSGVAANGPVLGQQDVTRPVLDDVVTPAVMSTVTLAQAVDMLPVGRDGQPVTLEALRMARKQDSTFPAPVQVGGRGRADVFDLSELVYWREGKLAIRS